MSKTTYNKMCEEFTETVRGKIRELLSECAEGQVGVFNRMYGSIEDIKPDQMNWAMQQIERTLEKNKCFKTIT